MKNVNGVILASVIIAATSTLVAQELRHKPIQYGRTLLGAIGVGFGLSVVATTAPNIADQLAWLIIISSLLVNGEPIFAKIATATGTAPAKPTQTHITPKYL